jgi:hypothetical protein
VAPAAGTIDYSVNYSNYREIPTMIAQGYTHVNDKNATGNINDNLVHNLVTNDMLNLQIKITDIFISNNDNIAHEIKLMLYHVIPTIVILWDGTLDPGDTLTLGGVINSLGEYKTTIPVIPTPIPNPDVWTYIQKEDAGAYIYYGLISPTGGWKVRRKEVATETWLQATGPDPADYALVGWAGRVGHTYDYL